MYLWRIWPGMGVREGKSREGYECGPVLVKHISQNLALHRNSSVQMTETNFKEIFSQLMHKTWSSQSYSLNSFVK